MIFQFSSRTSRVTAHEIEILDQPEHMRKNLGYLHEINKRDILNDLTSLPEVLSNR